MIRTSITPRIVFALCLIILLLSCTACSDCGWGDKAKAWVDVNENGIWDDGEAPLSGVQFFIDDVQNDYQDVGREAITDENGEANLIVWMPGCPNVSLEISVQPPDGYRSTTPDRIAVSKKELRNSNEDEFLFGFIPVGNK